MKFGLGKERKNLNTESFLLVDNIYDSLHEDYENGLKTYYDLGGFIYRSSEAKDEADRELLYIKTFDKTRDVVIEEKKEEIQNLLLQLGFRYKIKDMDEWANYVSYYIENIFGYPYKSLPSRLTTCMSLISSAGNIDRDGLLEMAVQSVCENNDEFILKGVKILLGDHPVVSMINEYIGSERK